MTVTNHTFNSTTLNLTYWYTYTYYSTSTTPYNVSLNETNSRGYLLSSTSDQVLAILLPIFSIPGILLNVVVLWSLLVRSCKLNKPTRQLHGHLVISNLILLIVCVPAISVVLYKGRKDPREKSSYQLHLVFCNISGYIFNVMQRMTIHISTILAVDRALAVQFPIFHKFRVQKFGYTWLLVLIWLFNLVTMATPFMAGREYKQGPYEAICNWNIEYSLFSLFKKKPRAELYKSLILLTYFFIPFTFTNFLTIICCIWVIALLLKKNLVIIAKKRKFGSKSSINGSSYEPLSGKPPLDAENGFPEEVFKSNGQQSSDDKQKPSNILTVTRNIKSPVAILKKKKLKLSDSKVKRACYTMLIVILLQLACYSVAQLAVVDILLHYVFKNDFFREHMLHNAVLAQIFVNYPLYILIFAILIPAVIHFRMTRATRADSAKGFTTHHFSSFQSSGGVKLNCPNSKKSAKGA